MQEIVDRCGNGADGYLLPIITDVGKDNCRQYQSAPECHESIFKAGWDYGRD